MPRKIRGFARVDSEDAKGWLVRIKRGQTRRSRFISDSTHGGKRKAMLLAKKIYEDWVAEMPKPDTSFNKVGVRNTTGIVGVHFAHDVDDRYPNCQYQSYVASWLEEDGRRRNVRFSCSKYGEDAFELACIAREKKLADRKAVVALLGRRTKKTPTPAAKAAKSSPAKAKSATSKSAVSKVAESKIPASKVAASKVAASKVTSSKNSSPQTGKPKSAKKKAAAKTSPKKK